jgi:GTP-binding protein
VLSIVQLQAGGGQVRLFSALKRQGLEEAGQILWDWAHGAAAAAPGEPPALD